MQKFVALCGNVNDRNVYYADRGIRREDVVIMSVNELTKVGFDNVFDECYEETIRSVQNYLTKKSVELVNAGCIVLLDLDICSIKSRDNLKMFYQDNNISCQWYYMDLDDPGWHVSIDERNRLILETEKTPNKNQPTKRDNTFLARLFEGYEIPPGYEVEVSIKIERKEKGI